MEGCQTYKASKGNRDKLCSPECEKLNLDSMLHS